jgi:hypothetical protein
MRHLNNIVKDTAKIYIIKVEQWSKHYEDLWSNRNEVHIQGVCIGMGTLRKGEIEEALKTSANRKATGPDGINMKLLMYGSPTEAEDFSL